MSGKPKRYELWAWASQIDWRVWAVFAALLVQVSAASIIYYLGIWRDPSTHMGAVFSSWVGGLAIFVVSGVVVALVSIKGAEHESFDTRARILFRRQRGTHIEYIIRRIAEIVEHYAESTDIKVALKSYNEASKLFRISVTHDHIVRSYLDDIMSTYNSSIGYSEVTLPSSGGEPNKLIYVRVGGKPIGNSEEFADSIERKISTTIDKKEPCKVEILVEFWIRADDEPNDYTPKRFTQALTLLMENHLSRPIKIKFSTIGDHTFNEISIASGESKQLFELPDVPVAQEAFTYYILAP